MVEQVALLYQPLVALVEVEELMVLIQVLYLFNPQVVDQGEDLEMVVVHQLK